MDWQRKRRGDSQSPAGLGCARGNSPDWRPRPLLRRFNKPLSRAEFESDGREMPRGESQFGFTD